MFDLSKQQQSKRFWLSIVLSSLAFNGVAWFYQYILGVEPCALCVHIRAFISLIAILGLLGFIYRKSTVKSHLIFIGVYFSVFIVMERGITALLIEKGAMISSCTINAGFPRWLALDEWIPSFFQPGGLCGTPVPFIPGIDAISFVEVSVAAFSVVYVYLAFILLSAKFK